MKPSRLFLGLAALLTSTTLFASACSNSDEVGADPSGGNDDDGIDDDGAGASGPEGGACLLHNCESDEQCAGCSDGRNTCNLEEKRCVACGPQGGCPAGQECSSYGNCVPAGLDCPTDAGGIPTITCASSADCAACDPAHLVCDTASKKCVACTAADTSECQSTDVCEAGKCAPACPKTCHLDNDCNKCGTPDHPAKACNAHKCSECSPTYACPAGMLCSENGVCIKPCGIPEQPGVCDSDADCTGCGGDVSGSYVCDFPINGGLHGKCKLSAAGCSDLGSGTVVMPEPWNQVTEFCSGDADCAGAGVELNVGKILRDLTGIDEINDANVYYGMNVCADVELANDLSCGLCVPCSVDSDCNDIDIDALALEAFGPLGSIAAAILLDQVFGNNEHTVFMYCESITSDYGVCAPCPGVLSDCSNKQGGAGGTCNHDVDETGGPLDSSCGDCEEAVCAVDSYCCTTSWDQTCVNEVSQYCSSSSCNHSECTTGGALSESCNDCAWSVCGYDPYCCESSWDSQCVSEAQSDYNCSC